MKTRKISDIVCTGLCHLANFWSILPTIVLVIGTPVLLVLAACHPHPSSGSDELPVAQPEEYPQVISVTEDPVGESKCDHHLRTIKHDDHLFICYGILRSQAGVAIIHHPGCPCMKGK